MQNLVGEKFGMLTVTRFIERKSNKYYWECICECGTIKVYRIDRLRQETTISCGCYLREKLKEKRPNRVKPVDEKTLRDMWHKMLDRCYNSKVMMYKYYGGKGVKVCEDWHVFENFYKWSVESRYKNGLSIDRINVNGIYEPTNCKWSTRLEQMNNTTKTVYLKIDGEIDSLSNWARRKNINRSTFYKQYMRGLYGKAVSKW